MLEIKDPVKESAEAGSLLRLPELVSDGCVLQMGRETRIWGWAEPFGVVTVCFQGQDAVCRADSGGEWQVMLSNLSPGGPFSLRVISESGEQKEVGDVYVGEVFLCAGQSNMELPMDRVKDRYPEEMKRPEEPRIRLYKVTEHYDFQGPLSDHVEARWRGCSPESIGEFSAVSYFFGRFLLEAKGVPIGLLNVSLGGSPVEAWMGKEALLSYPLALETLKRYQCREYVQKQLEQNVNSQNEWYGRIDEQDIGWNALKVPWKEIRLPAFLKDAGLDGFCGSIWLRKRFDVPESMAGKPGKLWLGTLVDSDKTYVNGVFIGETPYQYPPRKYHIPQGVLKSGENEIRIRLICDHGAGRMTPGKTYAIFSEEEQISLEGTWEYRIGYKSSPAPTVDFPSRKPTGLYNGMLAPCIPYTIRGVLWYQGESNDDRPDSYEDLLRRMILFWRERWGQERLPFVVAQLPGFSIDLEDRGDAWPRIREAQAKAASLPDVAVTVNLDLGESNDLHPFNKKDVAWRMVLAARGMIYGDPVVWKGPELRSWEVNGSRVRLTFESGDDEGLLVKNGSGMEAFELAGADGRYYPAEGRVEEQQITLWCKEAAEPEFLRYSWSNAPGTGLLYNHSGLPAAPFRLHLKNEGKRYGWGTHLFLDGWSFTKQPLHTSLEEIPSIHTFQSAGLPHDWLIYQGEKLYEDSTGWYRKRFFFQTDQDRVVLLRFDGIYMDSTVYVNGRKAGEWKYGYSAFDVELTRYLRTGENEIMVRVDHQAPNGRWYSGAGIYRNVWLKVLHRDRILSDGLYVSTKKREDGDWDLTIRAEILAAGPAQLRYYLTRRNAGEAAGKECLKELAVRPQKAVQTLETTVRILKPEQWDTENPVCYVLKAELYREGEKLQEECQTIGFRTIRFDPDQGFLLNGRKQKLKGVCEHHDLGCLGAAYHSQAMRRKFTILKEMGVNAVRLSHNMPAQDVMELADEMGILIVSEAFDMWERSKTPYDYARFFRDWYRKDVASWIRRDRNHPSLIMWSIGNEIYDTHADGRGQVVTKLLKDEVRKHDPWGNAGITIASNYMPWENARKCADILKLAGYNYAERYYEEHHREHPDWIIYGSETSSTVQSRGVYHFPFAQSLLADEDEQCSALGNSTTSWGAKSSEACIIAERDHDFSCGQFIWTGFDYIGEPTPYHTRNSYFGQVDTAGFPKDSYYIYQAEWTDWRKAPMVHVFPYWDFNDGQRIDVRVCSNAPSVELFFNGRSQGSYEIDHRYGDCLTGNWQLPYEPGVIKAAAYDDSGNLIAEDIRSSFGEAERICLNGDRKSLKADGQDLLFVTISMKDSNGNPVENANNRVFVNVSGNGRLVGLDNGDSTDTDEYKGISRRLFGGKLLLVAAAGTAPGELKVSVKSRGMKDAFLTVPVVWAEKPEGASPLAYGVLGNEGEQAHKKEWEEDVPVRTIKLVSEHGTKLTANNLTAAVTARICPENASDQALIWSVVNDSGIPSKLAELKAEGNQALLTAKSDGCFRLRCMSKCGTEKIRILSSLEFSVEGLGETFLNPYEFISAGLYDYSRGEVGNGNEHGVATAREGETQIGFHNIDFGSYGSDEITIPVFALTDEPYRIRIYEGMPEQENSRLAIDAVYQKPSVWNVYQEETYHLDQRLKGVTSLCFVLEKKVHIKGFSFTKQSRGYERLPATDCDQIYGDSFLVAEEGIRRIGNNVTIVFKNMEFGETGADRLTICGFTPNETNTILVRFMDEGEGGEEEQLVEFPHSEVRKLPSFSLVPVKGTKTVEFVFLPGSNFDFFWFQFGCQPETNRNM